MTITRSLLINCRRGILQYAIIKPLMSIAATILMPLDLYTEGDWDPKRYYLWSTLINNICVTVSKKYVMMLSLKGNKKNKKIIK